MLALSLPSLAPGAWSSFWGRREKVDWIVESGREGERPDASQRGVWRLGLPTRRSAARMQASSLNHILFDGRLPATWTRQRPCPSTFEGQSSTRLASHTPGELLSETAFGGRAQTVAQGGEPGVRLMGDLLYRIEVFLAVRAATPGPMCIWTGLGFVESIVGCSRYPFSPPHLWLVRIG